MVVAMLSRAGRLKREAGPVSWESKVAFIVRDVVHRHLSQISIVSDDVSMSVAADLVGWRGCGGSDVSKCM